MDWKCSYALDISCPKRQRLGVSENVKYIAVTSRASKWQVSKVGELRDLNPGLPLSHLTYGNWLTREARVQIPEFPNFGDLQLWSLWRYINVIYIFGNLQSLSIWTRRVKSVAACWVYDELSWIPLHYFRFSCMRGNPKSCSIVLSVLTQLTIMHLNSTQRVVAQLHCQIHNKVQRNPSNELLQVNSSQFETLKFS